MINLEYYKDEIIDKYINRDERKYFDCILCELRNKTYDCRKPCYQCIEESFDWLLKEHKEPIKLKQWEYDLLSVQELPKDVNRFNMFKTYMDMKEKGYFKDVTDTSMKLKEILDNCEVVE